MSDTGALMAPPPPRTATQASGGDVLENIHVRLLVFMVINKFM